MSFGGSSSKVKPQPLPPPAPTQILPTADKAMQDILERLKRARSRALSYQGNFGLLSGEPNIVKPVLSDILG